MTEYLICVDDTDDLTKDTSTGSIAEMIARDVAEFFRVSVRPGITRHQLLLDESVPYTSHNSSMCFSVVLPEGSAEAVRDMAWDRIYRHRADTSNPGLCLFARNLAGDEGAQERLIRFGQRAKSEYVPLDEAARLAGELDAVYLGGIGDTRQGMVGALAGIGLRLSGNDGRFRGKWDMVSLAADLPGGHASDASVRECEELYARQGIKARFIDREGRDLDGDARVILIADAKPVLRGGLFSIICERKMNGCWLPSTKKSLNARMGRGRRGRRDCPLFERDPDFEEHFEATDAPSCGGCLYRALKRDGIRCEKGVLTA